MAETLVEKKICAKCGADVRKDALFCYHCGGAVEAEIAVSANNGESVSSGWFRENIATEEQTEKAKDTTKLRSFPIEDLDQPIAKPSDSKIEKSIRKPTGKLFDPSTLKTEDLKNDVQIVKPLDTVIDKPIERTEEETKLRSAAAMRRKAKIVEKKRVEEVIWEEHENAPNGWFLLVALILIAIAAGLFFFAVFVK